MNIINVKNRSSLNKAADILGCGGIIVFPTDTVYGIGCLIDKKALKKLYKIKNRPFDQPTAVLLTKNLYDKLRSSVKSYIKIPVKMRKDFFEGRITLVFPKSLLEIKFPEIITKDNKIGIRLPQSRWLEKLINIVGPMVVSSANRRGESPPKNFDEIEIKILEKSDLAIRTTERLSGKPSAVYDLEKNIYLRN